MKLNTKNYIDAVSGKSKGQSYLAYEWADKPHRLVYDLCKEINKLRAEIKKLKIDAKRKV